MDITRPIKNKREVNFNKTIQTLILAAIIFAIAAVIGVSQLTSLIPSKFAGYGLAGVGVGVFLVVFIGGLFYGWFIQLTMKVLVGKGKYLDGLTTITYSLLPLSLGVIISAIVSYIPFIGGVISFLAMAAFGVIGYAMMFKLTKILFGTDTITAFIGVSVVLAVTFLATYTGIATGLVGLKGLIPKIPSYTPLY